MFRITHRLLGRAGTASVFAMSLTAMTVASTQSASAFGPRGHGGVYRPHGEFRHHGFGVGAAVGLGVLGAAAAGVAANHYYNGYPAYSDGNHPGYGYDYYPDHGGYYGPY